MMVYFPLIRALIWLVIPGAVPYYKVPVVTTNEVFNRFKEQVGGQIANLYGLLMLFWMFALPIGTGYVVFTQAESYRHTQLTTNSKTRKVRIKRLEQNEGSSYIYAVFDARWQGELIERRLDLKGRNYKPDDSATVRLSKDDIDIFDWVN
jgi:hypothetical protein